MLSLTRCKNTFNQNYTWNQFMLFYKDKNIEHKNETHNAWN